MKNNYKGQEKTYIRGNYKYVSNYKNFSNRNTNFNGYH